jgi:hypothetical protein
MVLKDKLATPALAASGWHAVEVAFDAAESRFVSANDLALQLYTQAFMWFYKVAVFRQVEVAVMYESEPTSESRAEHKLILEKLILEAGEVARRIRSHGDLIKRENGFTLQDLEAAIEDLENTSLQWHGGMSQERKSEILRKVLYVEES